MLDLPTSMAEVPEGQEWIIEMINNILIEVLASKELGGEICKNSIPGENMYVATNEHRMFGTRVMCRKDVLRASTGSMTGQI